MKQVDPKLAELAEKLFPGCYLPGVVECLQAHSPEALVECARQNLDQKERMIAFLAAAGRVAELTGTEVNVGLGLEHLRDPGAQCEVFAYGKPQGDCRTDGHYLCDECKERDPDLIRDPESRYYVPPMQRRQHKGEW